MAGIYFYSGEEELVRVGGYSDDIVKMTGGRKEVF
jgi:hypothetical protein